MALNKQTAANRRNSRHSTGPKTPAGKAICSLNALRDGLYADTLILPGEDKAEFDKIRDRIQALYRPQDSSQQKLVGQMAAAEWKMLRAELIEAGVLIEYGDQPASACNAPYARVLRVEGRLQRTWFKLYKELDGIKTAREKAAEKQKEAEKQAAQPADRRDTAPKLSPAQAAAQRGWATPEEWEQLTDKERKETILERYQVGWKPHPDAPTEVFARFYRGKPVDEFPPEDDPPKNSDTT